MKVCIFAMVLTCCIGQVRSQSESRADWTAEQWTEQFKLDAKEYTIKERKSGRELELHSKPLLNWTNPSNHQGLVFHWTIDGRPEVICSLFKYVVNDAPREKRCRDLVSAIRRHGSKSCRFKSPFGKTLLFVYACTEVNHILNLTGKSPIQNTQLKSERTNAISRRPVKGKFPLKFG
jgi:hypothetical protein